MNKYLTFIFLLLMPISLCAGEHLEEYWQQLSVLNWQKGPYKIDTYYEYRFFEPISRLRRLQISERFIWAYSKYLEFRFNLTLLANRGLNEKKYIFTKRLELEINPTLPLPCNYTVSMRNRLECRKVQFVNKISWITRNRLAITKFFNDKGPLTSIGMLDEIFYNYDLDKFTENRFTFLELGFRLPCSVNMLFFAMLKSNQAIGGWTQAIVLGTQFNF